jgi:hypothetical protein
MSLHPNILSKYSGKRSGVRPGSSVDDEEDLKVK